MSSSVPTRCQRQNQVIPMTCNYVNTPGYLPSLHGPYVFVSPVLVPCVEAPKNFGKGKSKKQRKSAAKVRYVPALLPHHSSVLYNQAYNINTRIAQPPTEYYSSPFAMSINPDSQCFKQGYLSALYNPATGCHISDFSPQVIQSDLNPNSRPYTPANRNNADMISSSQHVDCSQRFCWVRKCRAPSECSFSELWGESASAVTSRAPTPVATVCTYCRGEKQFCHSDTDSGVGGESDEDGFLCTCDVASSVSSDSLPEKDLFDIDLRFSKKDFDSFSKSTKDLVEFLSSNLQPHEWRTVARELGVDDVIIQSADYDEFDTLKEKMNFVFCIWAKSVEVLSPQTTRTQVEKALREIGRADMIDQME